MNNLRPMRIGLLIEPLDTLFCRDGRPFGASTIASGGLPQPQTLAGAIRTHVLRRVGIDFSGPVRAQKVDIQAHLKVLLKAAKQPESLAEIRCRGPWLAQKAGNGFEVLIPTPADVVTPSKEKTGKLYRLFVPEKAPSGWGCEHRPLPLWWSGEMEVKPAGGYQRLSQIEGYLKGGELSADVRVVDEVDLFNFESRTGIAIDAETQTAAESMIYSLRLLRLKKDVRFYAELDWSADADTSKFLTGAFPDEGALIQLGGEGRWASVKRVAPVNWPEAPSSNGHALLLTIAPAFFKDPPHSIPHSKHLSGGTLQAAAVPGTLALSGWDLSRNCPKPTRRFVIPGSVYYIKGGSITSPPTFAEGDDALIGYGLTLLGRWNYA